MAGKTNINGAIRSSFGMDLIEISAGPNLEGKSLKILFKNASNSDTTYNVEIWTRPEHMAAINGPIASKQTHPAAPLVEIKNLAVEGLAGLDLVITRTDTNENAFQPGQYTIQVIVN